MTSEELPFIRGFLFEKQKTQKGRYGKETQNISEETMNNTKKKGLVLAM